MKTTRRVLASALALTLIASFVGLSVAQAADKISVHAKFWTSANSGYSGLMKNIDVVFLNGTGAVVDSFAADSDATASGGEYDFTFHADRLDWEYAVDNSTEMLVSSDAVSEEYTLDKVIAHKSYYMQDKSNFDWGAIWNGDVGGSEPEW
ncbi:MAG: hypothetical protein AAFX99_15790 [Myxococcota bacterium]